MTGLDPIENCLTENEIVIDEPALVQVRTNAFFVLIMHTRITASVSQTGRMVKVHVILGKAPVQMLV